MNARFLVVGTIAGAIVLYAWQTISNTALDMVLPWHTSAMKEFPQKETAVQALRAIAPVNGLYYAPQGAFVVVSMSAAMEDKSQAMGLMLGRQLVIDLAVAFLMTLVVTQIPARRARDVALLFGVVGLAAAAVNYMSLWNWYGFPPRWASLNTIDQGIGWFAAGLAIGLVAKRLLKEAAVATV